MYSFAKSRIVCRASFWFGFRSAVEYMPGESGGGGSGGGIVVVGVIVLLCLLSDS